MRINTRYPTRLNPPIVADKPSLPFNKSSMSSASDTSVESLSDTATDLLSPDSSFRSNGSASTQFTDTFHDGDEDEFGWFDHCMDHDHRTYTDDIRNAWMSVVEQIKVPSECDDQHHHTNAINILYEWHNPQPSLSLKVSITNLPKINSHGINVSSCVSGVRIVQSPCGEIRAEYQFIFCYGSISYTVWRPYNEFKKLADIIKHLHSSVKPLYTTSIRHWNKVEEKKRWFRCLEMKYLIEKSMYLGKFMESLLLESPSPGLILAFVKHSNLATISSW